LPMCSQCAKFSATSRETRFTGRMTKAMSKIKGVN